MRLFTRWVFIVFVVACVAAPLSIGFAADQDQPEQIGGLSYSDEYDQTKVTIDVFVRDRDGNPVTGLTSEQFRLFQDGEEVATSYFAAFTQESFSRVLPKLETTVPGEGKDRGGIATADEAKPIFIVIFVDNQHLYFSDRNEVLRSLRTFVNESLGDQAQIMVVSYQQSIEIMQPFTSDSRAIADSLRRLRMTEAALDERNEDLQAIRSEIRRSSKYSYQQKAGDKQAMSDLRSKILAYGHEEEVFLDGTLNALRATAAAMAGIAGRKSIIYVSNGLPLELIKDLLYEYSEVDKRGTPSTTATQLNKRRWYDGLAAAANAQDITIHAIDATGGSVATAELGDSKMKNSAQAAVIARNNRRIPLELLAEKTGGLAIIRTDDFDAGLDRIRADLLTYYSIGHTIDSSASDTVHRVEIKLDVDAGAKYRTRYRRTFVEKSIESRVQDEVTTGLFFEVSDNPLGIEVVPGATVKATESQWLQPLTVSLPVTSLGMTLDGDEYAGQVVLFSAVRNTQGNQSDVQRQTHDFRLPAGEFEQRKEDRFTIEFRLLLTSGEHDIVIGILDQKTHQTSFSKVRTTSPE